MTSEPTSAAAMATLLRVRHARAQIALAAVGVAGKECAAAAGRLAAFRGALVDHDLAGADFAARAMRRTWLSVAAGDAARLLGAAQAKEADALDAYHDERGGELVVEKLLERIDEARRAAAARADQAVIDELAIARHARAAGRRAGAGRDLTVESFISSRYDNSSSNESSSSNEREPA